MTITQVIIFGLVIIGFIAMYIPRLFVIHKEKLTRNQFVEKYSEFKWIEFDLIVEFFIFTVIMLGVGGSIYLLQTPMSLGLFSIIISGMALCDGLFTVITGVCRIPYPKMPSYYVYDSGLRKVGWIQVVLSSMTIVTAIVLAIHKVLV